MPVMSASHYEFDSMVQRFHEYQWIWAPVVCKEFPCKHETHNWYDSFVVVVTKYHVVIGQFTKEVLSNILVDSLIETQQ